MRSIRAVFATVIVALCAAAQATSLQISPVTVDMPSDANAVGITLSNPGTQPLYGQVRVFRWGQNDTGDTLDATQDIVASPPLIQVAPHSDQLVRLVRQTQDAVATEQSYRILIDEIPHAGSDETNGVTIRLRYSVPIFIHPAGAIGKPNLSWQLLHDAQGWLLHVANTGNRHGQIGEVKLLAGGKTLTLNKGLLGYVLAGREQQWKVALDPQLALQGPLTLHAMINGQAIDATVSVSAPH
ncbi:fimbrial biogenesis chaperone [Dyella acidiphila]|uniref:Molecular chaperone n=1 Tax=Dyella acidiphila TaxID=2775866 RepID=A0ABR9GD98_9GAMM|nr:molecular chaperone [Dyella acidiphila]MBE1162027.1 molecular chaperone [Dyella acidiphila]